MILHLPEHTDEMKKNTQHFISKITLYKACWKLHIHFNTKSVFISFYELKWAEHSEIKLRHYFVVLTLYNKTI